MSATDRPLWPLASEVARAIVAACALEGDDPIEVAQGGVAPRSRVYAFIALAAEFREIDRHALARLVGWNRSSPLASIARPVVLNIGLRWFDIDRLNSVRRSVGWSDTTIEEAATAPLQSTRKRREAFERGRKCVREKQERRRAKFERRKKWQAGEPPDSAVTAPSLPIPDQYIGRKSEADASQSRALTVTPPCALPNGETIPSRELTLASELARGERLVDVTAEFCGDPGPERSALRSMAPISETPTRELRSPDEVFVERWMMEAKEKP